MITVLPQRLVQLATLRVILILLVWIVIMRVDLLVLVLQVYATIIVIPNQGKLTLDTVNVHRLQVYAVFVENHVNVHLEPAVTDVITNQLELIAVFVRNATVLVTVMCTMPLKMLTVHYARSVLEKAHVHLKPMVPMSRMNVLQILASTATVMVLELAR